MKAVKFRKMTKEELEKELLQKRSEFTELKFNVRLGKAKDYSALQFIKSDIARINTVLLEKKDMVKSKVNNKKSKEKKEDVAVKKVSKSNKEKEEKKPKVEKEQKIKEIKKEKKVTKSQKK
jgi:ribosomal protein L29